MAYLNLDIKKITDREASIVSGETLLPFNTLCLTIVDYL